MNRPPTFIIDSAGAALTGEILQDAMLTADKLSGVSEGTLMRRRELCWGPAQRQALINTGVTLSRDARNEEWFCGLHLNCFTALPSDVVTIKVHAFHLGGASVIITNLNVATLPRGIEG